MLHYRTPSKEITLQDLKDVYASYFKNPSMNSIIGDKKYLNVLYELANTISKDSSSDILLEDKVIIAIAIRVKAENLLREELYNTLNKTNEEIDKMDIWELIKNAEKYKNIFYKVTIFTPEIIHLNAFGYEPLIDIGTDNLVELYLDLKKLS